MLLILYLLIFRIAYWLFLFRLFISFIAFSHCQSRDITLRAIFYYCLYHMITDIFIILLRWCYTLQTYLETYWLAYWCWRWRWDTIAEFVYAVIFIAVFFITIFILIWHCWFIAYWYFDADAILRLIYSIDIFEEMLIDFYASHYFDCRCFSAFFDAYLPMILLISLFSYFHYLFCRFLIYIFCHFHIYILFSFFIFHYLFYFYYFHFRYFILFIMPLYDIWY